MIQLPMKRWRLLKANDKRCRTKKLLRMTADSTDMAHLVRKSSIRSTSRCNSGDHQSADPNRYPNRPINHSKTLPFHDLFTQLFNPLNDNKKKPIGRLMSRAKQGPHGPLNPSPHEARRLIIERFISRWRNEVGDDFYPALRLIIPEKDRDRALYGMKEKTIGKLLVKLMKIDKNSEDGYNLLNWKLPGQSIASRMAGDFAGRCYEVVSKRPMRTTVGDMRVAEVNEMLDKLSGAQKEEQQLPIFEVFYNRMNAEELLWLIRIILRQMKVGATERTFLSLWHPDGEALFSVSSSLRRVCWELTDPSIRLEGDETGITVMQCFQPQLAQFQIHSFQKMVDNMRPTAEDTEFWIEEKLDGERMQLHMIEDDEVPGGKRFCFWSRKAKDYTYLYGSGLEDPDSALTQHVKDAFDPLVRNIILDGEMITWDPESDIMVPFGTLKTAALSEQRNPYDGTQPRPLFRVFDILYLNDEPLTRYTLRDRRRALERVVKDVHRRLEIHKYTKAHSAEEIEPQLRKVVAEASEGLVLKNPRSMYHLNSRNDDWLKVKPEYMTDFGESLDVIIIGGYYGSGRRGGRLSSFMCGLRVDPKHIEKGANPMKCWSFFKVGGGFRADDYAAIRHHTEGKWQDWDPRRPPTEFIELAGGDRQLERPDVWIKPSDSVVISAKGAQVTASEDYRTGYTVRFPRFKALRLDRSWDNALSIQDFVDLKQKMENESKEKAFTPDKRRRATKKLKRDVSIAGNEQPVNSQYAGPKTMAFEGLKFCILSESLKPEKKSKVELEQLVKVNGGQIYQSPTAAKDIICITDKKVVKAASLIKSAETSLIKPIWLLDSLKQIEIDAGKSTALLPFEPRHIFFAPPHKMDRYEENVDQFGDSYARDVDAGELETVFEGMSVKLPKNFDANSVLTQLIDHGHEKMLLEDMQGWIFRNLCVYVDPHLTDLRTAAAVNRLRFSGANVAQKLVDKSITHVISETGSPELSHIRKEVSTRSKVPRIVTVKWIEDCWRESTRVDEEGYAPYGR